MSTELEPVTYQESEAAVQMSAKDFSRLSHEDVCEIVRLSQRGLTQRKIAEIIGCSQPTVCYALQKVKASPDLVKALMQVYAPEMVGVWRDKALKAQDHRGAREFVEAAVPELRPQATKGSAGGGGITINIGTAERPIGLPDIVVSPVSVGTESETPQE